MSHCLSGYQVLVTRPEHQAENLCRLIEQHGGTPIRFPSLQIVEVDDWVKAADVITCLPNYQWLIFTSANAVNFALKAIGGKIGQFGTAQIAAIGQATALALESVGISVNLIPKQGFDSESLLAMPQMQGVTDKTVLIVRGQDGRDELANSLRTRGAKVDYWEVYQRFIPPFDSSVVTQLLGQGKLDAVIITSCEALQNLATMLGKHYFDCLASAQMVVISDRIRRFAVDMGFKQIAVTDSASDTSIVNTLVAVKNECANKRGTEWRN